MIPVPAAHINNLLEKAALAIPASGKGNPSVGLRLLRDLGALVGNAEGWGALTGASRGLMLGENSPWF